MDEEVAKLTVELHLARNRIKQLYDALQWIANFCKEKPVADMANKVLKGTE